MLITAFKDVTRDQLLSRKEQLQEATLQSNTTKIQLKDGLFTVASLRRLSGEAPMVWGA